MRFERLIELWQAYQKPVLLFFITLPVHMAFGVEIECGRCGVPEMTPLQTFLFVAGGIESIVIPLWII